MAHSTKSKPMKSKPITKQQARTAKKELASKLRNNIEEYEGIGVSKESPTDENYIVKVFLSKPIVEPGKIPKQYKGVIVETEVQGRAYSV